MDHYRPPTKLRESNVFSRVCLSVHRGDHVTITHDAFDLTVQGPPALPLLVTSGGQDWRSVHTCSFEDPRIDI